MENKEYIERGALLKTPPFTKYGGDLGAYDEGYLDCAEEARKAVNNAPAADVVEVTRCKDCTHWGGATYGFTCSKWSGFDFKRYTAPRDFCSEGVKKDAKTNNDD